MPISEHDFTLMARLAAAVFSVFHVLLHNRLYRLQSEPLFTGLDDTINMITYMFGPTKTTPCALYLFVMPDTCLHCDISRHKLSIIICSLVQESM